MHKIKRKVQQKQESRDPPVYTGSYLFSAFFDAVSASGDMRGISADDSFDEAVGAGGTAKCSSADIAAD